VGLIVAQSQSEKPSNILRKKPSRNHRARPTEAVRENLEEDQETSEQCPEPNGYFADAEQCDKYYACSDGKMTEKLCPDGMVFNDYSPDQEKCDLPYNIDCSKRSKLQEPKPSINCPRQNGYFGHKDKHVCDKFYYCVDGMFNSIVCPAGLVFNQKTGICTWPDEAHKLGCSSEELFQFTCPKVDESVAITHPRYADPDDCQYFYVCINGDRPRRNGCKLGQAFDEVSKRCDWARKIPECADWYKDRLTDEDLEALENPPTKSPRTERPRTTKGAPRRKPARKQQREPEEEDEK